MPFKKRSINAYSAGGKQGVLCSGGEKGTVGERRSKEALGKIESVVREKRKSRGAEMGT